jgi:flagellar motility protein MotE (MotC chaperone)
MADDEEKKDKLSRKEKKELKKKQKEDAKKAKRAGKEGSAATSTEDEEEETVGGGIAVAFAVILIIAVWLAIFGLLIKMDIGGFGSTVLYPVLKDVPIINKILPEGVDYGNSSKSDGSDSYNYSSISDAVTRIKELEKELKKANDQVSSDQSTIADLQSQVKELQTYKDNEANYEALKKKFDEEVVFSSNAPDINEYKKYYESIDPDNAQAIYKEVVEQQQDQSDLDDYVKAYSAMKPAQAASIFDTMTDNLSLVAKILNAMDSESRGKILGAMDQTTAAQVTKLMEP